MKNQTYYHILGVSKNASQEEIKSAYRKRIKEIHPDINPHITHATRITEMINEAYKILSNPALRAAYDRTLNEDPETVKNTYSPPPQSPPQTTDKSKKSSSLYKYVWGGVGVLILFLIVLSSQSSSPKPATITNTDFLGITDQPSSPTPTPTPSQQAELENCLQQASDSKKASWTSNCKEFGTNNTTANCDLPENNAVSIYQNYRDDQNVCFGEFPQYPSSDPSQHQKLQDCLQQASDTKISYWTSSCKDFGANNHDANCDLPNYYANAVNQYYRDDQSVCFKEFPVN